MKSTPAPSPASYNARIDREGWNAYGGAYREIALSLAATQFIIPLLTLAKAERRWVALFGFKRAVLRYIRQLPKLEPSPRGGDGERSSCS